MNRFINHDAFWISNPKVLFNKNNFYQIIPTDQMNLNEKLNALTRLFIYLFIIMLIIPATRKFWYIPIILILLIIIYYYYSKSNVKEKFEEDDEPEEELKEVVIDNSDKRILDRNFYKVPDHDQSSFAKWVYDTPETCKENSMMCYPHEDLRFKRHNPDLDRFDE